CEEPVLLELRPLFVERGCEPLHQIHDQQICVLDRLARPVDEVCLDVRPAGLELLELAAAEERLELAIRRGHRRTACSPAASSATSPSRSAASGSSAAGSSPSP